MRLSPQERAARKDGPIHRWFGLSYAAYLVLPRLALQEMPVEWQERFVRLLEEAADHGLETPDNYSVQRRGPDGKLMSDPWRNYRHGSVEAAKAVDRQKESTP